MDTAAVRKPKVKRGFRYGIRTCRQCGKTWTCRTDLGPRNWAYRLPEGKAYAIFCSWSCLRAWEKEHPPRKDDRHFTN